MCCSVDEKQVSFPPTEPYDENIEYQLQSMQNAIDSSATKAQPDDQQGIVGFHDEDPGAILDLEISKTFDTQVVSKNAELDKFLNRPVLIQSYSIPLGGFADQVFDPWFLFMNHPSIKKKLDNYYLFRGNLKIKVVLNASPFYYGAYLVSYRPLTSFQPANITNPADVTVPRSQRPSIWLYPQSNQGGEMILPFLWHRDWLDITEEDDVRAMGRITFSEPSALKNANSVLSGTINVQIYASLLDYELSGPTVKLSLQSGKDEYGEGVISKPSSAIARAAGQLEDVPIIGKFATATRIGASAISNVASLFGFSNPPDLDTVESFTPAPFPRQASTDISTGVEKLTIDSKNELSIDSSISGAELGDELNITSLVTRESYLTKFVWTASRVTDDLLFNIAIGPNMYSVNDSVANSRCVSGTPLWMVSRLFDKWRGDIEIRFKFIASQYHRGRVRISWDPNGDIAATPDSTTEVYNKIIDIARCNDITIRVPYIQDTAYCQCEDITNNRYSTSPLTYSPFFENGILTVRVLNEQTSPVASADIDVLVYVKACENFEFADPAPVDYTNRYSPYQVQSGIYKYDEGEEEESNIALVPSKPSPYINLVYQGETIKSLRQLLRRYSFSRTIPISNMTNTDIWYCLTAAMARRPLYPGYDPNGLYGAIGLTSGNNARYNWCTFHPLLWISRCFVADRGSINIRANFTGPLDNTSFAIVRRNRIPLTRAGYTANGGSSLGKQNLCRNMCTANITQFEPSGMTLTNGLTNTSLSASLPFYSIYKFLNTAPALRTLGTDVDRSNVDGVLLRQQFTPTYLNNQNSSYNNTTKIDLYYAAGTDYNPVFFLNVPTMFRYLATPSSSETIP
jgi:hypothetical protein